jgi:cytoskeletal protein CcmA (bactofilin family)
VKRSEILRRLEERLARGEISEKTYVEIKARYEAEPEEPEPQDVANGAEGHAGHAGHPEDLGILIERTIRESVEPMLRNMPDLERRIRESVEPAISGMRFADFGEGVQSRNGNVKIVGSGVVTGNPVRANEFKSAGSGRVVGDLEATVAKAAGSCVFEGNVTAREFHTAGSAKVAGQLRGTEIHSSGSLSVGGDVESHEVHVRGSMTVGGRTTAHEFRLSGGGKFGGPLEAREVDIELGGDVSAPVIHGTEVNVRRPGGFFRGRCELRADRIAAREVNLECTTANLVVGEEVVIGPHCRIGVVEARELTVHESSEVKERRPLTRGAIDAQAGYQGSGAPPPPAPAAPPSPSSPPAPPVPPEGPPSD